MNPASGIGMLDDPLTSEASRIAESVMPGFEVHRCEPLKWGKSAVFAVHDSGDQHPLVLKRAGADTIAVEYRVLTWLHTSPLPSVRAWAVAPAADAGYAWLVSDFVGGAPYDRRSPAHRALAGTWLGDLHAWSASVATPDLPSRDSDYLRGIVAEARATLEEAWETGPALSDQERTVVRSLADSSGRLIERWESASRLLEALPTTLVHSGIAGKNVRIVPVDGGHAVMAFDWEQGGWGCPAADVSMVDVHAYALRLRRRGISLPDPDRVGAIGRALWCLAGVPGERGNLTGNWPHRAAGKLDFYRCGVDAALDVLDPRSRS